MNQLFDAIRKGKVFKGDRVIWFIYFFLCLISIMEVYSASSRLTFGPGASHLKPLMEQLLIFSLGTLCVFVFQLVPSKAYVALALLGLPAAAVFLVCTSFGGSGINGTNRWANVAGFSIQPSELVKCAMIMWTALMLSRRLVVTRTEKGVKVAAVKGKPYMAFRLIMFPLVILDGIIFKDNVSTSVLLFFVIFAMMYFGRVPRRYLVGTLIVGTVAAVIGLTTVMSVPDNVLEQVPLLNRATTLKHRVERFGEKKATFGSEEWEKEMLTDNNSQSSYSAVAIANSNIVGVGPGNSVERDFLQHAESDFIFAIIVEETGVVGIVLVMFLYFSLLARTFHIAKHCHKYFQAYLVLGFGIMIVLQAMINMAVAAGAIPVTGQPLPLISRGGSSIIVNSFYFGVILSVSRHAYANNDDDAPVETPAEGALQPATDVANA